jgi:hypothetical protein
MDSESSVEIENACVAVLTPRSKRDGCAQTCTCLELRHDSEEPGRFYRTTVWTGVLSCGNWASAASIIVVTGIQVSVCLGLWGRTRGQPTPAADQSIGIARDVTADSSSSERNV